MQKGNNKRNFQGKEKRKKEDEEDAVDKIQVAVCKNAKNHPQKVHEIISRLPPLRENKLHNDKLQFENNEH